MNKCRDHPMSLCSSCNRQNSSCSANAWPSWQPVFTVPTGAECCSGMHALKNTSSVKAASFEIVRLCDSASIQRVRGLWRMRSEKWGKQDCGLISIMHLASELGRDHVYSRSWPSPWDQRFSRWYLDEATAKACVRLAAGIMAFQPI